MMYQSKVMNAAKRPRAAATYCLVLYLYNMLDVWYKIDPEINTTINPLKASPKLKPKNIPAKIIPKAMNPPIIKLCLK